MTKKDKILALIPARSGSKGLSDKNIRELNGKPLMAYSIECALKSELFSDIIVSTDSEKYADVARKYGASVPFLRSSKNSADNASSLSVICEVLEKLEMQYDIIVLLQPTSPLRKPFHIQEALQLFYEKNADSIISVTKFPHSLAWVNYLPQNMSLNNFVKKEYLNKRRQELPEAYMLNGAVYIFRASKINENFNMFGENSFAYLMDRRYSFDIDDIYDFIMVESILKNGS